jgi:hypothetical protein
MIVAARAAPSKLIADWAGLARRLGGGDTHVTLDVTSLANPPL